MKRHRRGRRSVYIRILLSLSVLGVFLVVLLAMALGVSYERYLADVLANNDRKILKQISYSSNVLDNSSRVFATSVYSGSLAPPLMFDTELGLWDAVKLVDAIRMQVQSASSIHSVYVYNRRLDRFYSTAHKTVESRSAFFDTGIIELLSGGARLDALKPVPRIVPGLAAPNAEGTANVFTYVLPEERTEEGSIPTSVIVNVKAEYLVDTIRLLSSNQAEYAGTIYVLDNRGRLIGSPSKQMFLSDSLPAELRAYAERPESDSRRMRIDGEDCLVSKVASLQTGWVFLEASPYRAVMDTVLRQRALIVAICAVFVFLAVILSILLSRTIYRPIRSLVGHVRWLINEQEAAVLKEDELSFVASAFSTAVSRVKALTVFRHDNLDSLRSQFHRELLQGIAADEATIEERLVEIESRLSGKQRFRIMLLRLDLPIPGRTGQVREDTNTSLSYASTEITSMVASRFGSSVTVEMSKEDMAIIAGSEEPITTEFLRRLCGAVGEAMNHVLGCTVSGAVSAETSSIARLGDLYRDVRELICYRLTMGPGAFIEAEDVDDQVDDSPPFPVEIEKSLLHALGRGRRDASLAAFDELADTVDGYSYENILLGYTRLASRLFDYLNTMEGCGTGEQPLRFTGFMQRLGTCLYIDEIHSLFAALLEGTCDIIRNASSRKIYDNVARAREIMEAEYADPCLNAHLVADSMRMSPVYLGRIFREVTSESMNAYLNRIRLERACDLLLENGRTAKEVSERVGFSNTRYFFTKFKIEYGVTPTQFRTRYSHGTGT